MLPVLCPADRGRNSEERRRQRRETTTHVGLEIVRAVVVLLTFLGLVSRDVKPENVGVVGEGRIALIDWDRGRGRGGKSEKLWIHTVDKSLFIDEQALVNCVDPQLLRLPPTPPTAIPVDQRYPAFSDHPHILRFYVARDETQER